MVTMSEAAPQDDYATKGRVLVVDDDASIRDAIAEFLSGYGYAVLSAENATACERALEQSTPDLLVLDVMMPGEDGLSLCRRLAPRGTPILMLSALGRTSERAEGLEAGADDSLAKPFEAIELVARVRALHRRASGREHSAVILFGAFECHVKARTAFRDNRHIPLSPREFELFRYFMENAGEVVTREMLLRDVWNMSFDPQTNVVDVNIGRLRRKLEEGFDSPALETVWGTGYRLLQGRGQ